MMKSGVGANKVSRATGVRVQSSLYGIVVPQIYGLCRVEPKLIWTNDFRATKQATSKKGGGKKGGGDSYNYSAACDFLLGHWPVQYPGCVWTNKDFYGVLVQTQHLQVTAGAVTIGGISAGDLLAVIAVNVEEPYAASFNDYGGDGPLSASGTWQRPLWNAHYPTADGQAGSTRAPYVYDWHLGAGLTIPIGGGTGALNGKYVNITVTSAAALVQSSGVWTWNGSGGAVHPLAKLNLEFEPFLNGGSEFASHPEQQIDYNWCAGIGSPKFDLGSANMFPTLGVEVAGAFVSYGCGDAEPVDIITDLLLSGPTPIADTPHAGEVSNIARGLGLPAAFLGDTSAMRAYCRANGITASLYLDSQRTARDILEELFAVANTAPVISGSQLKCIPYSEVSCAGGGAVYVAPTAAGPACDLDDTVFLPSGDSPLVSIDRKRQAAAANVVKLTHLSRANGYNDDVTTEVEQRSVAQYGTRPDDARQYRSIAQKDVAQKVASIEVKRSAFLRNTHKFSLPATHVFLEAMDLVTLTEPKVGLFKHPVRLTSVEESEKWDLTCEAEDFLYGLYAPTPMEVQPANPYSALANKPPGPVSAPLFFEPPDSVATGKGYDLWMAISGESAEWGGCVIWRSSDGVHYEDIGFVIGKATMGVLSSALASAADPDNTNTLAVDLSQSDGELLSVSADDKDSGRSLCWVDGELVSYQTSTQTGANAYGLTALRRGLHGSPISSHISGAPLVRLNDSVFKASLDASWAGKTIYFKFTSFNTQGNAIEDLAEVEAYTHTLSGRYHNFLQIVQNDAVVDAVLDTGGTTATVRVYGGSPATPGHDIAFIKSDDTSFTQPAASFAGKALSTVYEAMFNPVSGSIYLLTTQAEVLRAVGNGHIDIGPAKTPAGDGTGGISGGGSNSGGGGFGGGYNSGPHGNLTMPLGDLPY